MKIKKFRIRNYKSIKDSGDCWLASDITVLAGKNESGKTAVLEALRDFNLAIRELDESCYPLDSNEQPTIRIWFSISRKEAKTFADTAEIALPESAFNYINENSLCIEKDARGNYYLDDELRDAIDEQMKKRIQALVTDLEIEFAVLSDLEGLSTIKQPHLATGTGKVRVATKAYVQTVRKKLGATVDAEGRRRAAGSISRIEDHIAELDQRYPSDCFTDALLQQIPHFVFFSGFENVLPFEIDIAGAENNVAVRDFAEISGLEIAKLIQTEDTQRRINMLNKNSVEITGDFKGYWKQDNITLAASCDGDKLVFQIKEDDRMETFKPEQRSKGFQWFLSFYLRLRAEGSENKVVLIDEPGQYLHAKAQHDVLKVLSDLARRKYPIVISTHSPYLIAPERIDRVRLTSKTFEKGTVIRKSHSGADLDTRTPILTAIGWDIAKSFNLVGQRNVLLEGISDYYYLQAFASLRGFDTRRFAAFIPCTGVATIPNMTSFLLGWGLAFAIVLDNDKGGRETKRKLKNKLQISEECIILLPGESGSCIEDILSISDFRAYVLPDADLISCQPNSQAVKKYDKVILALEFFNRCIGPEPPSPDDESLARIDLLLGNLKSVFNGIPEVN